MKVCIATVVTSALLLKPSDVTLLAGTCEDSASEKLCKPSPTIVRLNVVRENRHNKCVSSTVSKDDCTVYDVQLQLFLRKEASLMLHY